MRIQMQISILHAIIGLCSIKSMSAASDKVAIPDDETGLVKMSEYEPPEVPEWASYYFPKNFRILNCWECFEAQGKICIDEGHGKLSQHTGSGDPYNAFCCKQDYNEGYCKDGQMHKHIPGQEFHTVCSQKSIEEDAKKSKYKNVLSSSGRNYQMFAFCPNINQRKCGVSTSNEHDMQLRATTKRQLVYSKDMHYRDGNDTYRESDACYYEITLSDRLTTQKLLNLTEEEDSIIGNLQIRLNFTKLTEMNAYIYGGKTRKTAYENLTDGNVPAEQGVVYNISAYRGFLVVAFPNKDKDTEFAFNYWVEVMNPPEPETEPEEAEWFQFQGEFGENVFMSLVGSAGLFTTIVCILCCLQCVFSRKLSKFEKDKKKKQSEQDEEIQQRQYGGKNGSHRKQHFGSNGSSFSKHQLKQVQVDPVHPSIFYEGQNGAPGFDHQGQAPIRVPEGMFESSVDALDCNTEGNKRTDVKNIKQTDDHRKSLSQKLAKQNPSDQYDTQRQGIHSGNNAANANSVDVFFGKEQ